MLDSQQLPYLFAFAGVLITVASNIILGILKDRADREKNEDDDEGDFQDRILASNTKLQDEVDKLKDRVARLEEDIDLRREIQRKLMDDKHDLEQQIKQLTEKLQEREAYIAAFERKVWYKPPRSSSQDSE